MFDPEDELQLDAPLNSNQDEALVNELAKQSLNEIQKLRAHERRAKNVRVDLWAGNSSDTSDLHLVGRTNDISEGGCAAIFPSAVLPGDVFRLGLDQTAVDIPLIFARALRCRMLSEGSFEVGFRFFNPVRLIDSQPAEEDLLS